MPQSMGHKESDTTERRNNTTYITGRLVYRIWQRMPGCLGDWVIKEHGASILGNLCFLKKIFYLSLIFISWLSQHQVIQTLKLPREEARMARN